MGLARREKAGWATLLAFAAALAVGLLVASSAQAARSEFYGIAQGQSLSAQDLSGMAAARVHTDRFPLVWASVEPQKNKITIDPQGNIFWNGSQIDKVTLRQYLDQSVQIQPEPELHFQPDPQAQYEVVDEVLAIIKRSAVTKLGFVGNEQYRNDF